MATSRRDDHGGSEARVEAAGDAVFVCALEGHVSVRALANVLEALERAASECGRYFVVVDATRVTGYQPNVRKAAAVWSADAEARGLAAVAVVTDSEMLAAESPAVALAPPRALRLFASVEAATKHLRKVAQARSGKYAVVLAQAGRPGRSG